MRASFVSLLLLVGLAFSSAPAPADDAMARLRAAEKRRVELIERIAPAVGAVFKAKGGGGGSGVLISPEGYMLTNFHVTSLDKEMRIGLPDGKRYPAKVIGIDPQADIALLRLIGDDPTQDLAIATELARLRLRFEARVAFENLVVVGLVLVSVQEGAQRSQDAGFPVDEGAVAIECQDLELIEAVQRRSLSARGWLEM